MMTAPLPIDLPAIDSEKFKRHGFEAIISAIPDIVWRDGVIHLISAEATDFAKKMQEGKSPAIAAAQSLTIEQDAMRDTVRLRTAQIKKWSEEIFAQYLNVNKSNHAELSRMARMLYGQVLSFCEAIPAESQSDRATHVLALCKAAYCAERAAYFATMMSDRVPLIGLKADRNKIKAIPKKDTRLIAQLARLPEVGNMKKILELGCSMLSHFSDILGAPDRRVVPFKKRQR